MDRFISSSSVYALPPFLFLRGTVRLQVPAPPDAEPIVRLHCSFPARVSSIRLLHDQVLVKESGTSYWLLLLLFGVSALWRPLLVQ